MKNSSSRPGLVFAGGVPRSGLTLLRRMLAGHPQIFAASETNLVPAMALQWTDFGQTLGSLHRNSFHLPAEEVRSIFDDSLAQLLTPAARKAGADIIIEKSPLNILVFKDIATLIPKAKFLHVVRDGRDVAASLLERDWRDPHHGTPLDHTHDPGAAAAYWRALCQIGLEAEAALVPQKRLLRVHFEELVGRPKRALRDILAFLDLPWREEIWTLPDPFPLAGMEQESAARLTGSIDPSRAGRWRRDLPTGGIDAINAQANEMLAQLGYR